MRECVVVADGRRRGFGIRKGSWAHWSQFVDWSGAVVVSTEEWEAACV